MNHAIYPWQHKLFQRLSQNPLPATMLLSGPSGIGKWHFVSALAARTLCAQPNTDNFACGECTSCNWLASHNHADLYFLLSEAFADKEGISIEGEGDSKKKKSNDITIDNVRKLLDKAYVTSHTPKGRIVLINPADRANIFAANALLKIIEEPPPKTSFILISENPHKILPTILSRCIKITMPQPSQEEALAWWQQQPLFQQLPKNIDWLALHSYRPLAIEQKIEAIDKYPDFVRNCIELWGQPLNDKRLALYNFLMASESLSKIAVIYFLELMQKWLFDLILYKKLQRLYYFPHSGNAIETLSSNTSLEKMEKYLATLDELKTVATHPLSARLFVDNILLQYRRLFR